jgi:probable rRNA maturation factor
MMKAEDEQCLALEVQYACAGSDVPDEASFCTWTLAALGEDKKRVGLVIRIVDEAESRALNKRYRGKDKPTNVLSFPFEAPQGVDIDHLGDLVICAAVVDREAADQHKPLDHHWAHMVVHGVLHLRGYDHQDEQQASAMEALETQILKGLGIADPYIISDMAV